MYTKLNEYLSNKNTINELVGAYENDTKTDTKYWECRCKNDFVHPKSEKTCQKCKQKSDDGADARVEDVEDYKEKHHIKEMMTPYNAEPKLFILGYDDKGKLKKYKTTEECEDCCKVFADTLEEAKEKVEDWKKVAKNKNKKLPKLLELVGAYETDVEFDTWKDEVLSKLGKRTLDKMTKSNWINSDKFTKALNYCWDDNNELEPQIAADELTIIFNAHKE